MIKCLSYQDLAGIAMILFDFLKNFLHSSRIRLFLTRRFLDYLLGTEGTAWSLGTRTVCQQIKHDVLKLPLIRNLELVHLNFISASSL